MDASVRVVDEHALPGVQTAAPDPVLKAILPIGRTGWSIAAGYLGLFGIVIWPLAPFALAAGVYALVDLGKKPDKGGRGRAWFGATAGGLGTLSLLVVLIALSLE